MENRSDIDSEMMTEKSLVDTNKESEDRIEVTKPSGDEKSVDIAMVNDEFSFKLTGFTSDTEFDRENFLKGCKWLYSKRKPDI